MPLTGRRTFVGFGFGAIQAGLFLYEAFRSGGFARLVVGEVAPDTVAALLRNAGGYAVNVAHADRVETARVGPVEVLNPTTPQGIDRLVEAVAEAEEISTAVPSVQHYVGAGQGSIHRILALGLRKKASAQRPRAVVYAAENHNHAAEILEAAVYSEIPSAETTAVRERVRFLNTVIGKMSGVVPAGEISRGELVTITPGSPRAFLVEDFNRILISQVCFPSVREEPRFHRGLGTFVEKGDLLPFEEAKLYGHNATHALAAYLSALRGLERIADLRGTPCLAFIRAAFVDESGAALIRKHVGKDRLFTPEGYREYADDLIERMTNPHLQDSVERVGRDPRRKLGWDDRLVGTMRVALQQDVVPRRYAIGAAAALATLEPSYLTTDVPARALLAPIWGDGPMATPEVEPVLRLIDEAKGRLKEWRASGFGDLSV